VPLVRSKKKDGSVKLEPMPHSPGKCGHIINMLCNYHPRNEMLANFTAAAYKKGRTILVQSDRKEHLETLAMMFQKLGIPPAHMGYYVGGMKAADLDNTKAKRIILATYQMTAEGTDIPWLDTLVMATPKSDVRQIVGRIIRQYEGKQEPVVFDLVDASSNVFAGYWNSRRQWYGSIDAPLDLGKPAN
jgi:superfamily II DNA or RNA helicase